MAVVVKVACAPSLPVSCSVIVFSPSSREEVGMEIGREPTTERDEAGEVRKGKSRMLLRVLQDVQTKHYTFM